MIRRRRVAELAEQPWYEPYAILAAIVSAGTREEFDRLEPKFGPAYRRFKAFVFTRNRYPWTNPDGSLDPIGRDDDLDTALNRLDLLISENPAVFVQDPTPRALEIALKLIALRQRGRFYIRRGTTLPGGSGESSCSQGGTGV
jgi:hypothetical protein